MTVILERSYAMAVNPVIPAMFLSGVISHLAYFKQGEHHLHGTLYVQFSIGLPAIAIIITVVYGGEPVSEAFVRVILPFGCFLSGLYGSLILYRIFFSPLKTFPGPLGARLSNLWFSAHLSKRDAHKRILALHQEYGDFCRIGSSDLSITHPKAVHDIYGFGSKCTKGDWYDLNLPLMSMHTSRQQATHDQRRRIWSPAFSDKALRGYEDRIKQYQDQLVNRIASFDGLSVNITKWFNLFSFDVLGDLAFGSSFDMLRNSQDHWAIKLLKEGMIPLGWTLPTWLFRVLIAIPGATRGWWRFNNFCCQTLDDRMNVVRRFVPLIGLWLIFNANREIQAHQISYLLYLFLGKTKGSPDQT